MARLWTNSGVKTNADLQPTLAAGPTINVAAGQCWVDGHFCELTAPASVPVTAGPGILVVRFTPADNHAELLYRDGVSVPTQTDPTYEMTVAFMSGGTMFDRRGLAVGGEFYQPMNAIVQPCTAINPTYGVLPGTTLPLWHVGQYVLTCCCDIEIATAAVGNLAYVAPQLTGPVAITAGGPPRTFIDMNAVRRDVRQLVVPLAVSAPAAAVITLGACKGSATGVFNAIGSTGATWLHARRVG
jgi:hypothetical protein